MRGAYKGFFVFWVFFFILFLSATNGYSQTITATAGPGGSISPSGAVPVAPGSDQTFIIFPDPGYGLFDILVDSVSVGASLSYSYTFSNVQADHSIEASFSACDYQFPVLLDSNGWIYSTIMEAYNDALSSDTIMLMAGPLPAEDLNFAADISVFLDGGYDCSFLEQNRISAIPGSLTVSVGTVTPSNLVLSGPLSCVMGDPDNFPGNQEICDGLDNNCNGIVDDGLDTDADGDGHYSFVSCLTPNDDCDDSDPNNFPGNPEVCDDADNNCDGQIDEGLTEVDADSDGYTALTSCGGSANDCDDADPNINPGAADIPYDGIDQDCSGADLTFDGESCVDCHAPASSWNNIHDLTTPPDGTCETCHAAEVYNILSGHYGKTVRSADNNMTAGSIIVCESCHDADSNNHSGGVTLGNGSNFVGSKISSALPNITCDTCHENRAADHGAGHTIELGAGDLSNGTSCGACHAVASWTEIEGAEHNVATNGAGSCATCHNSPRAEVEIAILNAANPTNCLDCHSGKEAEHGIDHVATGYVILGATSCAACHDPGGAANATVDVTHNGTCTLCHTTVPFLQPGIPAGGGDCNTCHDDYFPNHTHHNSAENDVTYNEAVDKSQQGGCALCHHDYDTENGTSLGLGTWETILVEHDLDDTKDGSTNTCDNCHTYDGSKSAPLAAVQNAISSGNPATCVTCHTDKENADHGVPTDGKHPEHLALPGVSCGTCHDMGNPYYFKSGTDANGDGLYDFSETDVCDACHQDGAGNPTPGIKDGWNDPGYVLDCSSCHGVAPATASHPVHLSLTGCGSCHDGTVAATTAPEQHLDNNIDVYDNTPFDLGYIADKPIGSAYASCSSSYCHSTVQGVTDPTDPPSYVASPTWGTPFGGTVETCTGCHGSGGHVGDAGTPLTTGSHAKHLDFRFDQDATCNACHFDWSYTGCVTCHQRQVNHVDNSIDVMFKPNFPLSAASSSGTYTGDPAPRTAYGSCSALYCHSPGTKASAPYDDPNVTNISWGGTSMPTDCTGCHDGDSTAAQSMATGSHGAHIANYDCAKCHARTVDNSRSLNSTINTPKNYTYGQRYHVDGWVNVAFSSDIATSGAYNGFATPISLAPGSAAGSCSNTYCHSDGTSVSTTAIPNNTTHDWGTGSLACDSCHSYAPAYANGTPKANSHTAHNGYSCDACHYSTTTTGDTITNGANHANQVYDVQAGTGITFTYTFDSNGGSCASISCHSGNSAVWGIPLVGGCSACHGNPPDYPNGSPKINSHLKHNDYNYSCAECHFATTNDGLTITDRSLHANGVMDVTFSDPTMNYNPGSHTCSNTYCHSNGMAVEGMTPESTSVQTPAPTYERTIQPNTSPAWGGVPLSCISCHDVMDDLDIYPNVIAGGPGYPDSYPDLQYKATSHGGHQFLGCNVCHYNTTNDGVTISDTASHVNRVYNLDPDPGQVATIGYAYDVGGGSCAAVCHGSYNYHNGNQWRWGYNTLGASGSGYYVGSSMQVTKNLLRSSGYGEIEGPYAFYIDWGDGTSETVMSNGAWQQGSWAWHQYETSGSKTFNIWIRDSRNHLSLGPATRTFTVKGMCPSGDDPDVTYDNTRVVPDHDYEISGYTVTITDLSVDPDYFCNRPSNYAGDFGLITIDWGDGTVETFEVHLTQDPNEDQVPWGTTKVFSHTYSAPFSGIIKYGVEDNVHYNGGNSYPPMPMNIPDVNVP